MTTDFNVYENFAPGDTVDLSGLFKNKSYFNINDYIRPRSYGSATVSSINTDSFFDRSQSGYSSLGSTTTEPSTTLSTESVLASTNFDSKDASLSFEELLKLEGVHYRVSSHKRTKELNSRFKSGSRSWHVNSDWAWDIVPNGVSWQLFKKEIYGNPRIINWLKLKRLIVPGVTRSLGIIDETRPEVMAKTGASGPHLHVGPDSWATQMLEEYLLNPSKWGGTKDMVTIGYKSKEQKQQSIDQPTSKKEGGNYIKINKALKTLTVYDQNNNVLKSYPVTTGINSGAKQKSGDNKTPETKDKPFYIQSIEDSSGWKHDFKDGRGNVQSYGKWFMRLGGTGFNGIGIHGAGVNDPYIGQSGLGYKYGSEGCIRLRNADIEDLYKYVLKLTPVYINKRGGKIIINN